MIYFISIVLQISVVYNFIALYLTTNQQEITVQMVWEEVRKSFWRILFLMILVGLGVFIGFLLFIIPGIYLAVAFSFSMAVLTIEKTSVFKAISRSYNLIRGNWWSTFGLTFAIGVIVAVISYALLLPYYLVIVLIGFNLAEDPQTMFNATSPFMIISSVYLPLYTVAVTILYAIPMIAIAFKYFSIVEEQESVGLMEEVDNINSRPSGE